MRTTTDFPFTVFNLKSIYFETMFCAEDCGFFEIHIIGVVQLVPMKGQKESSHRDMGIHFGIQHLITLRMATKLDTGMNIQRHVGAADHSNSIHNVLSQHKLVVLLHVL